MKPDQQQTFLRICSTFQYVIGGFLAMISCFPLLYLVIGIFMVLAGFAVPTPSGQSGPDAGQVIPFVVVGGVFMAIGGFLALIGLTIAVLIIVMGWRLMARKSYGFCITMAAIECVFQPFFEWSG